MIQYDNINVSADARPHSHRRSRYSTVRRRVPGDPPLTIQPTIRAPPGYLRPKRRRQQLETMSTLLPRLSDVRAFCQFGRILTVIASKVVVPTR